MRRRADPADALLKGSKKKRDGALMSEYRDKAKTVRSSARSLLSAYRKERAMKRGRNSAATAPSPESLDAEVAVLEPADALQASSVASEIASQASSAPSEQPEAFDDALEAAEFEALETLSEDAAALDLAAETADELEQPLEENPAAMGDSAETAAADAAPEAENDGEPAETAATEAAPEAENDDEPGETAAAEAPDAAPEQDAGPGEECAEAEVCDAAADAEADGAETSAPQSKSQERLEAGVATPVDPLFDADDVAADQSELAGLPGIGPGLIWALQRAGVASLADLAASDADALSARLGVIGDLINVGTWIEEARSAVETDGDPAPERA